MRNQTAKKLKREATEQFNSRTDVQLRESMPTYPITLKRLYKLKKRAFLKGLSI